MMITKPRKDGKFLVDSIEPLETLRIENILDDKNRFKIESSSATYVVSTTSKQRWLNLLKAASENYKRVRWKHAQLQPQELEEGMLQNLMD